MKQSIFSDLKDSLFLLFSFFFLLSWSFQALTKSTIQSKVVFLFIAKYVHSKVHIVWNSWLQMKPIHLPLTMQSVSGIRNWSDFRRLYKLSMQIPPKLKFFCSNPKLPSHSRTDIFHILPIFLSFQTSPFLPHSFFVYPTMQVSQTADSYTTMQL